MNKLLMIIDPQIDFITGTLPVPNAETAMDALAKYVAERSQDYTEIIITADRHPFDHCSFKEYGGPWPRHCVHDSVGAAVWQPIMEALYKAPCESVFLYKGLNPATEEYSIFKNRESAAEIDRIIKDKKIEKIDICGLAGDVCVADTITDGIDRYGAEIFKVLPQYSPSIDGGERLSKLINKYGLSCHR